MSLLLLFNFQHNYTGQSAVDFALPPLESPGSQLADAVAPLEAGENVLAALIASDWSGDFSHDFGPEYGGGAPIESVPSQLADAVAPVEDPGTIRSDPAGGVEMLETALNRLMQMEFSGTAPAGTTAYTTRFIANLATLMNRH